MKILTIIPARGGSKGVPRKNIKLLHGKPLVAYSIETGLRCPFLTKVIVSTEDEEIASISKAAGADVPFLRPIALASDESPTIDLIIHALEFFKEKNITYDAVCLLQPTVPFRNQNDLNTAIEKFINRDADCLFSARKVPHIYNPHWVFEQDKESGFLKTTISDELRISRRQDLPETYHRDGSIYLTKTEIILNQRSLYGQKIIHHEMSQSPNINIDTLSDWEAAEQYNDQDYKNK